MKKITVLALFACSGLQALKFGESILLQGQDSRRVFESKSPHVYYLGAYNGDLAYLTCEMVQGDQDAATFIVGPLIHRGIVGSGDVIWLQNKKTQKYLYAPGRSLQLSGQTDAIGFVVTIQGPVISLRSAATGAYAENFKMRSPTQKLCD